MCRNSTIERPPVVPAGSTHARWQPALLLTWVALALGAFAALAWAVQHDTALTVVDHRLDAWLHARVAPWITRVMLIIAATHGTLGMLLLSCAVALYLARHAAVDWAWTLLFAVPGVMLLNDGLKHLFRRPRPHFAHPLATLSTYSFPSGHAAASTAFYGFLAMWLISRSPSGWPRRLILAAAVLLVALVAGSRLYLGVHFLSDVLAGACESVAWLGLCLLGRRWLLARAAR